MGRGNQKKNNKKKQDASATKGTSHLGYDPYAVEDEMYTYETPSSEYTPAITKDDDLFPVNVVNNNPPIVPTSWEYYTDPQSKVLVPTSMAAPTAATITATNATATSVAFDINFDDEVQVKKPTATKPPLPSSRPASAKSQFLSLVRGSNATAPQTSGTTTTTTAATKPATSTAPATNPTTAGTTVAAPTTQYSSTISRLYNTQPASATTILAPQVPATAYSSSVPTSTAPSYMLPPSTYASAAAGTTTTAPATTSATRIPTATTTNTTTTAAAKPTYTSMIPRATATTSIANGTTTSKPTYTSGIIAPTSTAPATNPANTFQVPITTAPSSNFFIPTTATSTTNTATQAAKPAVTTTSTATTVGKYSSYLASRTAPPTSTTTVTATGTANYIPSVSTTVPNNSFIIPTAGATSYAPTTFTVPQTQPTFTFNPPTSTTTFTSASFNPTPATSSSSTFTFPAPAAPTVTTNANMPATTTTQLTQANLQAFNAASYANSAHLVPPSTQYLPQTQGTLYGSQTSQPTFNFSVPQERINIPLSAVERKTTAPSLQQAPTAANVSTFQYLTQPQQQQQPPLLPPPPQPTYRREYSHAPIAIDPSLQLAPTNAAYYPEVSPSTIYSGDQGFTPLISPVTPDSYSYNDSSLSTSVEPIEISLPRVPVPQRVNIRFPEQPPRPMRFFEKPANNWKTLILNDKENDISESNHNSLQLAQYDPKPKPTAFDYSRLQLTTEQIAKGYYTRPTVAELQKMITVNRYHVVRGLEIGRSKVGSIVFHEVTLRHVVLSEVQIERGSISVYKHGMVPNGYGLNVSATVTMLNIYPKRTECIADFYRKVEKTTLDFEGRLKNYDWRTGVWQFDVEHFSK